MELNLNSNEMKTFVETFVIEETASLICDNEHLDKWNDLVNLLGLEGQKQIVKPDKSPIPFMRMKTSLKNIFNTLCPREVDVDKYNITPIPVEILGLIALSKREGYFNKVQIWYDDKSPDPVAVGIVGCHYQPSWHKDRNTDLDDKEFATEKEAKDAGATQVCYRENAHYLIGRWADVKRSLSELKQMATDRYIGEQDNDFKKQIKDAQRGIDDLESKAFERFN
jgi:hypothetical protein